MVTPSDAMIVRTAFMDEPMSLARLVQRTGLTALRVNNAIDELISRDFIHSVGENTWALKTKKGSPMGTPPTPPTPPGAPAAPAKKVAKKVAKKAPAERKDGAKKAEVTARDETALALITEAKGGLTKEELATAMGTEVGMAHMSLYRLNRDGKITKTKGEGRQAKWIPSGK